MTRVSALSALAAVTLGLIAFILSGWGGATGTERVLLTGSSTVAPLVSEIAHRFERSHPGIRIEIETGGSARGIIDAGRGQSDIGMVSRALTPADGSLHPHLLAHDGLAIIAHAENPVTGLTRRQVADIYMGHLSDWREVGGATGRITLIHKAEGRATLEVFLSHFGLDNRQIAPDAVVGDNEQGIKTVAANPSAIGYVSIGAAKAAVSEGAPVKLLALDGVLPTQDAVADGRYPVVRELNLVTGETLSPLARRFLELATSPAVDDLLEAQGFVPPPR